MIGRVLVAAAAVAVLVWLGVMERDTRLQAHAVTVGGRGDVARAESQLRAARFLNPDTGPDLVRALLYHGNDEPRRAAATVNAVLRAEPDNISAWGDLFLVAQGHDRRDVRRARAAVRRLDPLAARGG